jgi:hypothetical protein
MKHNSLHGEDSSDGAPASSTHIYMTSGLKKFQEASQRLSHWLLHTGTTQRTVCQCRHSAPTTADHVAETLNPPVTVCRLTAA